MYLLLLYLLLLEGKVKAKVKAKAAVNNSTLDEGSSSRNNTGSRLHVALHDEGLLT